VTEIYHVTVYSPLEASLLRTQEQFIKTKKALWGMKQDHRLEMRLTHSSYTKQ